MDEVRIWSRKWRSDVTDAPVGTLMESNQNGDDSEAYVEYPGSLPEPDRELWNGMTASQRRKALDRLAAFKSWEAGEISVDDALKLTQLSRSRFYRLAADWRTAPSLAALGAFAGTGATGTRLDPDAVNALQAVVANVVSLNAGASVSQLVRLMVQATSIEPDKLPGAARLRGIVENELRRIASTGEAGHAVQFDCSAINLPRSDGRPHIMFVCLDAGTRIIFGASLAATADTDIGYRQVAIDALARISEMRAHLLWSARLTRAEFIAGQDLAASVALVQRVRDAGVHSNVQLAQVPKRYGRYFRQLVGPRIGRIEITPARTEQGTALPDNGDMTPWSEAQAAATLKAAINQHNATILAGLGSAASRRIPDDLTLVLETLSREK